MLIVKEMHTIVAISGEAIRIKDISRVSLTCFDDEDGVFFSMKNSDCESYNRSSSVVYVKTISGDIHVVDFNDNWSRSVFGYYLSSDDKVSIFLEYWGSL